MLIDGNRSDGQIMTNIQTQCTSIHHMQWVEFGRYVCTSRRIYNEFCREDFADT